MSEMTDFTRLAQEKRSTWAAELLRFLMENKRWWLLPIVLALLFFGALVALATTGAAPFIYALF